MPYPLLQRYPVETVRATPILGQWFTLLIASINYLLTGTQSGTGSPEGVVSAPQGSLFRRTDGGVGTSVYVKTSGGIDPDALTSTGWTALS
jgi:hypothetical protein